MRKIKTWTTFVPLLVTILSFVFLSLTAGGAISPYIIQVLLVPIPLSYAYEGYRQGRRGRGYFAALVFNFSLVLSVCLAQQLWDALTSVHDELYLMYHTWGMYLVFAMYIGIYLLLLAVVYTVFYSIAWAVRKYQKRKVMS
jgi:hypothetical protein